MDILITTLRMRKLRLKAGTYSVSEPEQALMPHRSCRCVLLGPTESTPQILVPQRKYLQEEVSDQGRFTASSKDTFWGLKGPHGAQDFTKQVCEGAFRPMFL